MAGKFYLWKFSVHGSIKQEKLYLLLRPGECKKITNLLPRESTSYVVLLFKCEFHMLMEIIRLESLCFKCQVHFEYR